MESSFSSWWAAMSLFEQIYWIIAIPATLVFVIQLVMSFIGGDFDDHVDIDTHDDFGGHETGFHLITFKNLIGFFTVFGWSGIACVKGEIGVGFAIFISIICGLIMMALMAGLYVLLSRMTQSGTLVMESAIGKTGQVYLTIPAKKNGEGKVQIKVQGALRTLDAMSSDLEDIKTGSLVEVIEIASDNILIVKRSR